MDMRVRSFSLLLALVCLSLFNLPHTARGQAISDVSEVLQLRVLPGWREAGGRHVAGLEITLKPGWHTYWRSAGSLGISPAFRWVGSRNVQQVTPIWPVPKAFFEPLGHSIGYDQTFVLPLLIETWNAGEPVHLAGQIDLGVCADICVPARVSLGSDLPERGAVDARITDALQDRPSRYDGQAVCQMRPTEAGAQIVARLDLDPLGRQEAVVFELPGSSAWFEDAQVAREGRRLQATTQVSGMKGGLERAALRITVIGEGRAVEAIGCTAPSN